MSATPYAHTLYSEFSCFAQLRSALQSRQLSAVEVAQSALDAAQQSPLNAFTHIDAELTLAQARAADARLADPSAAHPLAGVPIAHKDVFVTRGWRSSAASRMLAHYVSPFDATVVEKLLHTGAVSLGKLNCDEFAMGSANEHSFFGAVPNPWDTTRVAGGSSGGSAAAVAAGLVMAATGTDTGGSVRQPAALCGVAGIKPTYGTVSRYGMIAYASSLDQAGVIARHAQDLVELLDGISGFDERDATSLQMCGSVANQPGRIRADFAAALAAGEQTASRPLTGLRIGVPKEFFTAALAQDVNQAVQAALREFENLGAVCVEISLPRTELSIPAYYVIAPSEASSNLSRYDGVRYGHRAGQYADLADMVSRSRGEGFGAEVKRRILVGTYMLCHGYYDAYYLQAQRIRRLIAQDFQQAFDACDVIMGPVAPTTAKTIGSNQNDPTADWLGDLYTLGVNLAGLPAMSIPCGFSARTDNGLPLPIGLHLIGNYFAEGRLLATAHRFQQATRWHEQKPGQKQEQA